MSNSAEKSKNRKTDKSFQIDLRKQFFIVFLGFSFSLSSQNYEYEAINSGSWNHFSDCSQFDLTTEEIRCLPDASISLAFHFEADVNGNNFICNPNDQIICVQDLLGNPVYSFSESGCEGLPISCSTKPFGVGDKWTYEKFINFQDGFFQEFTIVDEVEWMGEQALLIKPGVWNGEDYMVQKDDKVYFWDDTLEDYQLNYDFNNDSVYYLPYFNSKLNDVDSIAIFIDSIRTVDFDGQEVQVQYCRSELDSPPFFEVVSGVERLDYGPRLPTANLADVIGFGDIRCFDSQNCSVKFVDFPCDTIFNPISTKELSNSSSITVYPDPVQDKIYLDTDDQNLNYQICNLQGQLLKEGIYDHYIEVQSLTTGIHFLRLYKENQFYKAIKFVKQ